jgi:hypothetical protein
MGWFGDAAKAAGNFATGGALSAVGQAGDYMTTNRADNEFREVDPNGDLERQALEAGQFANTSQRNALRLGEETGMLRGDLRALASGQNSISAEQLRQGLQQNVAGQQAMAASARPGNAAMAARTGAMQAARMGSGLAGQQAIAGIQERQAAQQALGGLLINERGQDINAALGSRNASLAGYGQIENARGQRFDTLAGVPTKQEQILGAAQGAAQAYAAKSDRRAKTGIKSGEKDADDFVKGLRAYSYKYKKASDGDGEYVTPMAQDIAKTKAGKGAVFKGPDGQLMVHGARLASAIAATLPGLDKRLAKLEGKGK